MYLKKKIYRSIFTASMLLSLNIGFVSATPITIEEQGSFTVGGSYKQHEGTFTQENFVSEDGEQLTVYTHARAHDGEANEAVIRLIAEHFGVAKTRVKIIRGATSKNKIIDVE